MARSKDWETYPEVFHDLIREASTREIKIEQASSSEARKLMGRMYAFHGALKRAAEGKEADGLARELATICKRVRYRIEGESLIAAPRDTDPVNASILAAIASSGGSTQTSSGLAPSANLLGLLEPGKVTLPDE